MGGADVIVAGGGHNGLICAAYLARSGIDTLVVEAQNHVGGCAATVEDFGVRFNVCNCDHTLIRAMPIADELDLASHGLEYLEPEVAGISLFHDGAEPLVFFHEAERMLDGLARSHPGQVDAYRRYLKDAMPVAELALEMAQTPPSAGRFLARAARGGARAARRLMAWSRTSALAVLSEYFDDWHLAMPAITTGPTVWGMRPDAPGTGLAAMAYANRHLVRLGRPPGRQRRPHRSGPGQLRGGRGPGPLRHLGTEAAGARRPGGRGAAGRRRRAGRGNGGGGLRPPAGHGGVARRRRPDCGPADGPALAAAPPRRGV